MASKNWSRENCFKRIFNRHGYCIRIETHFQKVKILPIDLSIQLTMETHAQPTHFCCRTNFESMCR